MSETEQRFLRHARLSFGHSEWRSYGHGDINVPAAFDWSSLVMPVGIFVASLGFQAAFWFPVWLVLR